MLKSKPEWSKSYPVRPRNYFETHGNCGFIASYEKEKSPATISSLMRGEYARKWLEERDKMVKKRQTVQKRFKNDYKSWLEKRKRQVKEK